MDLFYLITYLIIVESLQPSCVHGQKVWWTILWTGLAKRANMLSKVTRFNPKICPVIVISNIHMFLGTNFAALQSKLGPFSKSSDVNLNKSQYLKMLSIIAGISNIYVSGQICLYVTVLRVVQCFPQIYRTEIGARNQF